MKAKPLSSLLTLGLALAAALAHAQNTPTYTYSYSYGLSVVPGGTGVSSSGNTVNVGAVVGTGQTATGSANVQLLAGVTCKPSSGLPPTSITVPYELNDQAIATVTLGGMTPPSGTGTASSSVQNLLGNTGTVNRSTTDVSAQGNAGAALLDKSATVMVGQWTKNGDGTFTTWVVLETETLTARAHIDAVGTPPPPPMQPPSIPDDSANGTAIQTIQAVTQQKPGS